MVEVHILRYTSDNFKLKKKGKSLEKCIFLRLSKRITIENKRRLIASITKENEYGARHVTRCVGVFRKSLLYPTGKSGNEPR